MSLKNKLLTILFSIAILGCASNEKDVYLFSFFKGNGEDGLHMAISYDGYNWTALNKNKSFLKPAVGNDKLMRDPCIIKGGDNKFHMVWTVSWTEKGIGYANSEDLIHWSEQKYIPVMEHEDSARNCWAPEIFYDESSDQYLIYWATTITGKFTETDATKESGYNHRMYYTTTSDFENFSETQLLYDKGFNVIDATIVKNNDQYVMFVKDETIEPEPKKNIRVSTSKQLNMNYSDPSEPISPEWVEGPTAIKIDNKWIVYFDMYMNHKMGAVASSDLKNWNNISNSISFPKGTRHGTIFKVKESVANELINQLK